MPEKQPNGAGRGVAEIERAVERSLLALGHVVVAVSGGVDSAVLLALAARALGPDRVVAAVGDSPSLARAELEDAGALARALGVRLERVPTGELGRPGYRANAGDRCWFCRDELFEALRSLAAGRAPAAVVVYGAIADDRPGDRPGMAAAARHGVRAPLREAGATKDDVRAIARRLGLAVAEKPAAACLASRLPVGTPVTPERLAAVERAEAGLRRLGLGRVRVRHHGALARVELDREGLDRLGDAALRAAAARAVREAGFRTVAVDLDGYREGGAGVADGDPARAAPEEPALPRAGAGPPTPPHRPGGQ